MIDSYGREFAFDYATEDIQEAYEEFRSQFSPEKLAGLSDDISMSRM